MDKTAEELMAKAMYDDWKSRERVLRDDWDNVAPQMHRVFMGKATAALKGLQPMLVRVADAVEGGADVSSRFRGYGLFIGEDGY